MAVNQGQRSLCMQRRGEKEEQAEERREGWRKDRRNIKGKRGRDDRKKRNRKKRRQGEREGRGQEWREEEMRGREKRK